MIHQSPCFKAPQNNAERDPLVTLDCHGAGTIQTDIRSVNVRTLDEMMARMGFAPTDTGPFVTELRALIARQMSQGMVDRSAGTWAPGEHTAEDRARTLLQVEWAMEHGHAHEVKNIDEDWSEPLTMIGDKLREGAFHLRVMRDKVLGRRNPYRP